MGRAGLITLGAVVVLALAAGGAWLLLRDTAEPVTVEEAVTSFRTETDTIPGAPSPIPEGVYVYATHGFEKTDALTGVTHRYPRTSTITVTKDPCGVRMRWDVLRGRSTTWTFCVSGSEWTLRRQDERHTFFGRTEHTDYLCTDTRLGPSNRDRGATLPVSCSTSDAEERGSVRVVRHEQKRIAGKVVSTVYLLKTSTYSGAIRGVSSYGFWFERASGVPVAIAMVSRTTNDSAVGDVRYEEIVGLQLTSLIPRR